MFCHLCFIMLGVAEDDNVRVKFKARWRKKTDIKDQTLFIELNRTESKTYGVWFCLSELIIQYQYY